MSVFNVRTAADIAAASYHVPQEPVYVAPSSLGSSEGPQVMMSVSALGGALRKALFSTVVVDWRAGRWELRCPVSRVQVAGDTPADLRACALVAYRDWARDEEVSQAPLALLVRTSTNAELAAWLGLPQIK